MIQGNINIPLDLGKFCISDMDESGDPSYYGFLQETGVWRILEINTANSTFRYAMGSNAYTTNWGNRTNLEYGYYNNVF